MEMVDSLATAAKKDREDRRRDHDRNYLLRILAQPWQYGQLWWQYSDFANAAEMDGRTFRGHFRYLVNRGLIVEDGHDGAVELTDLGRAVEKLDGLPRTFSEALAEAKAKASSEVV